MAILPPYKPLEEAMRENQDLANITGQTRYIKDGETVLTVEPEPGNPHERYYQ
jgi:hypothetical protein